jgi:acyl carrier protein
MNRTEILLNVQHIFCDVLDDEEIKLSDETTADEIEDWDSLTHIQLIVAIEKGLDIKFSSKEILSWKNVGRMVDCIETKVYA